jgi:MFS family permease
MEVTQQQANGVGVAVTRVTDWPLLIGIIAAVSVFAVAQGLTYPLLSFILAEHGVSPTTIGLSAAMTPLGLIVSSAFVPRLARRFGSAKLVLYSVFVATITLALICIFQNVVVWFPLRFLLGATINPLFILSEAWMISLAASHQRGRAMGIYAATLSGGYALGPLTLAFVGSSGLAPFAIGLTAFMLCGLSLAAIRNRLPNPAGDGTEASVKGFAVQAPMLLVAVFLAAAFEQAYLSLFPPYGLAYALDEAQISALLSVLIVGNVLIQIPLGLAAERWRPRLVLIVISALTAIGCLLQPAVMGTLLIWPLAFCLGALSYGAYTVALVELGDRFSGPMLVAGNSAFALMWGIGSMAGPLGSGALMDATGIQALPLTFAVLLIVFVVVAVGARGEKMAKRH